MSLGVPRYTQPTLNSILKSNISRQRPMKKIKSSRDLSGVRVSSCKI